jgi:hypothetical protein
MQHRYVYSWRLRPRRGLEVELRIEAPSAAVARREVTLFLEHHDGLGWTVQGVRRWVSVPSQDWGDPDPTFIGPPPEGRS